MTKICIIGGGNIGTLLAAEFAAKDYAVCVYTSQFSIWNGTLQVFSPEEDLVLNASGIEATDNLSYAVSNAQQIWVTLPSFMFPKIAEELYPIVSPGQIIFCSPGAGAEFYFRPMIEKGCTLCGLQRVHSISRLKERGKSVYMLGRKDQVYVAVIPKHNGALCCGLVTQQLNMPCFLLENYLAITLTPSNPILHTARLYSMFIDFSPGVVYDHNILFYEEWSDFSSDILLKCDAELQTICRALPELDLHSVKSLKEHYESNTVSQMTKKIRNIKAFKGILSPMSETPNGWVPDFNDRYFVADFAFGLKIIRDIARVLRILSPSLDAVWNWYRSISNSKPDQCFKIQLTTKDELINFYTQ